MKSSGVKLGSFVFYVALLVIVVVIVTWCFSADPWTTVKPKVADLAGTYEYASDTLHAVTKPIPKQGEVRRLTLYTNGTFVASGVPVGYDNNTPVVIRAGNGTWSFRRPFEDNKDDQGIELDFAPHAKVVESCFIALTHEKPPYDLIFMIGDWDEQDTVRYVKVK